MTLTWLEHTSTNQKCKQSDLAEERLRILVSHRCRESRWRKIRHSQVRWRFVKGANKARHGSCAIYFTGGIYTYIYIYKSHIVVYIYIFIHTAIHTSTHYKVEIISHFAPARPTPSARRLLLLRLGVNKKWGSCNMAVDLSFVAAGDWLIGYHQLLPDAWENPGKTRGILTSKDRF